MKEVAIIGTGYVGTVTGACLAKEGHRVNLVDIQPEKVEAINEGRAPIDEPGLDEIIRDTVEEGSLKATTDLGKAVTNANVILLSLPTPRNGDGSANVDAVFSVAHELGELLQPETVVATRSTVPVGTTKKVGELIANKTATQFFVVSNPEFLAEGTAVADTLHPSRIILGTDSEHADEIMRELYHPFVLDDPNRIITMDIRSAEMTKLAANTILASDITVANVIAEICEAVGADYRQVQVGMRRDPRIGKFLHPGPGYGGSCFPKDVRALADLARKSGIDATMLDAITETNEHMKTRLFEKIRAYFNDDLEGRKIAVWGLSFKPNTDDVRESPAFNIVRAMTEGGSSVVAYDPKAMENFKREFGDNDLLQFAQNKYAAAEGAEALVIVTEWGTFRSADLEHLSETMKNQVIFDSRSIYDRTILEKAGFYYDSVGRQVVNG